ncbi:MAG TPA: metallophosphoesterase [Actinomycetota bacterium]
MSTRSRFPLVAAIVVLTVIAPAPAAPAMTVSGGAAVRVSSPASIQIAAAGDIACQSGPYPPSGSSSCQYRATSDLLTDGGLSAVLALGDDQYDVGAYRAFLRYFDPTWGRAAEILHPVPGNHEFAQDPTAKPRGYFRYFGGAVKGPDGLGYYSFDLPAGCTPGHGVCWHVVALSSELCFAPGGCGPAADPANPGTGNRMYAWLQQDLAVHPNASYPCTLAFWHHPLFSFSTGSGASSAVRPLWELLYRAHADVVLNGHSHNYQRWRPQDPLGRRDHERGIREFIAGTGGASHYALQPGTHPGNLAAAQDDAFGILRLSLRRKGYAWTWVPAAGQPSVFTDTKTVPVRCH